MGPRHVQLRRVPIAWLPETLHRLAKLSTGSCVVLPGRFVRHRDRVLRTVAEVLGLPIETLVGPGRVRAVARARAVAAYLLCNDAGLSFVETARIIGRTAPTAAQLTTSVAQVVGSTDPQAELLERARRRLRSGISSGKPYPPLPDRTGVAKFLPGPLACRLASGLKQPELAQRAGTTREAPTGSRCAAAPLLIRRRVRHSAT